MATRFRTTIEADGVRIALVEKSFFGRSTDIPHAKWATAGADRSVVRAIDALIEEGAGRADGTEAWLPSAAAAALSPEIADRIGLPPLAPLGLAVALDGRVESADGWLRLRWSDRSGLEMRPERTGIRLIWGEQQGRLSLPLLRVAEAADGYNRTFGGTLDERIAGWLPVQEALAAATGAEVKRDGFLSTFTLYQAGSFALDVRETPNGVDFTPLLMSRDRAASLEDEVPAEDNGVEPPADERPERYEGAGEALLPADDQRVFLDQAMRGSEPTRDAYQVGRNRYVVIDPALKPALDAVKAARTAPMAQRRAFLRNPRAAIAEALEAVAAEISTTALFIQTKNYSDRVEGLGLWERPKLPWLTRPPNAWLPEAGWLADGASVDLPPLSFDQIGEIEEAIETAEIRGDAHVVIRGVPIPVDAAAQVVAYERRRTEAAQAGKGTASVPEAAGDDDETEPPERLVLVIKADKTNFLNVGYELKLRQRPALIPPEPPRERMGHTTLRTHQIEGFRWLVEAWTTGWPGVLLADDMGLGKTFQALAFLAWLKSNAGAARSRGIAAAAGPILVVAPTALLKNWEKECAERLSPLGLGERVDAYGQALRRLKLDPARRTDPGETLDVGLLREADWILTTYETLTDHERAFARIPYAVVLFDEMQKVKAPDTLNTKAAKTLNADFVLGLTGTPIENRMEDLWCLFDRLVPGYLGDLKTFSRTFREEAPEKLEELKRQLDTPVRGAPAVMKRRMKADILDGLPPKTERKHLTPMPEEQARAYRDLIAEARQGGRSRGFMLKVLHGMRGISLHPGDPAAADVSTATRFESFANRSARLATAVTLLRGIAKGGQKALVFVEDLAMQRVVAEGLGALFDLAAKPAIINGATPGERRLAIVDAFEASAPGFGVLVLSPKAAGVGLNIVAANHVIHLSRWWNPAVEDQCNDRAYRMGQTKPVTIHLPIATHPDLPGEAFDEVLDGLLTRKRDLSRHMLAPPTGEGDIDELFKAAVRQE